MKKYFFFCLIILLSMSCSKKEYDHFATLYGIVTDSKSGEPVANVNVVLSPGGISKITGVDGRYEFTDLEAQQYTITVQKTGYSSDRKTITAVVDEKIEANVSIKKNE